MAPDLFITGLLYFVSINRLENPNYYFCHIPTYLPCCVRQRGHDSKKIAALPVQCLDLDSKHKKRTVLCIARLLTYMYIDGNFETFFGKFSCF